MKIGRKRVKKTVLRSVSQDRLLLPVSFALRQLNPLDLVAF